MNFMKMWAVVQSGRKAVRLEGLDEPENARMEGERCGRLAFHAFMALERLDVEVGNMCAFSAAWSGAVDGWYAAASAEQEEIDAGIEWPASAEVVRSHGIPDGEYLGAWHGTIIQIPVKDGICSLAANSHRREVTQVKVTVRTSRARVELI